MANRLALLSHRPVRQKLNRVISVQLSRSVSAFNFRSCSSNRSDQLFVLVGYTTS